jgi:hypothetical protein
LVHLRREGATVGQAGQVVGDRLPPDLVQGPELGEREDGPRERSDHARESADLAEVEAPVTPLDPEDGEGGDGAAQRHGEGTPPDGLLRDASGPPGTRRGGSTGGQHRVHHPREVERPPWLVTVPRLGRRHQDVADELGGEDRAQGGDRAVDAGSQHGRHRAQQRQEQDVRDRVRQVRRRGQGVGVLGRHRGRDEHRGGDSGHAERAHEPVQPGARPRSGHPGAQ